MESLRTTMTSDSAVSVAMGVVLDRSTGDARQPTGDPLRQTGMRWIALLPLVLLTACAGRPEALGPAGPAEQVGTVPAAEPELVPDGYAGRFAATGTVLEDKSGPRFCTTVQESLPPQCGGLDITNWKWDGLKHESAGNAKWGEYELIVSYDGQRLTLAEPPRVPQPDSARATGPKTMCPAPQGGWQPVDRAKATEAAFEEANRIASASEHYAGSWIDQNQANPSEDTANDPAVFVYNVRFTERAVEYEAQLRKVWGGSLCVSTASRTEASLMRIQDEIHSVPGVLSSGVDAVRNALGVEVWVATAALQQELDQKYGAGAVLLEGVLRPVDLPK